MIKYVSMITKHKRHLISLSCIGRDIVNKIRADDEHIQIRGQIIEITFRIKAKKN
jgi:hypothetical protein